MPLYNIEYEDVLAELRCAFEDAREALSQWENVQFGLPVKYAIYDGHVRDTNCQVRAMMMAKIVRELIRKNEIMQALLRITLTSIDNKLTVILRLHNKLEEEREFAKKKSRLPDNHTFSKVPISMRKFIIDQDLCLGSDWHESPVWDLNNLHSCFRIICFLYVQNKYKDPTTIAGINTYRISREREKWSRAHMKSFETTQGIITLACLKFLRSTVQLPDEPLLTFSTNPPVLFEQLEKALEQLSLRKENGLIYTPTYLGYLSLREAWLRDVHAPLCVVSKFHCDQGYHIVSSVFSVSPSCPYFVPTNLCNSPWAPVIIAEGDAYPGSREDFLEKKQQGPDLAHDDPKCAQGRKYAKELISANFDSALLSFFAWHPAYSGLANHNATFAVRLQETDQDLFAWYSHSLSAVTHCSSQDMSLFLPRHMYCGSVLEAQALMAQPFPLSAEM